MWSLCCCLAGGEEALEWLVDGLNTLSENEHVRPAARNWQTFRAGLVNIGKAFAVLEGKDPMEVDTKSPPPPPSPKPAGWFDAPEAPDREL